MKLKNGHVLILNELFSDLSYDGTPFQENLEVYGKEKITEAIAILGTYKSDRGKYVIDQLNSIATELSKEENDQGEKIKLLNKASLVLSYVFR